MSNIINIDDVKLDDSERRPTTEFNVGKKGEYKSRLCFCEEKAVMGCEARECVCRDNTMALAAE